MRVVLSSQILPAVIGYSAMLRELGHEPVALMCSRELAHRYGGLGDLSLEPADGRKLRCGEGTLWIVETEPA